MKTKGKTRIRRSQAGQSLLEVALLLPMLMLLVMGVIEMGRYMYIYVLVGNAARAGAAFAAQSVNQSGQTADIQTAAQNDYNSQANGQAAGSLNVTSSTSCGCDSGGTITGAICSTITNPSAGTCTGGGHWVVAVSVTAAGTYNSLFKYPGIPDPINVSNTATMRVAQTVAK